MPPAGELRITDVTHSTMLLNWDEAPGAVRKYIIKYKPEDADAKEVRPPKRCCCASICQIHCRKEVEPFLVCVRNMLGCRPRLRHATD